MNREKKLESLLIIAAGFIVLFFIFKIKWFLLVAFLVAFLGAMSKLFADAVTWLWFKISEILGWINARILLSVVFFIFLFPMALLMKAFGKSNIQLKKNKTSYYSERDHVYKSEDLENVW
jgi:flagellar biosynthesis protein FlhB